MSEIHSTGQLDLPLVVNGRLIYPDSRDDCHVLTYESGLRVRLPRLTGDDLDQIATARADVQAELMRLTTDDITWFLGAASDGWLSQQAAGRQLADSYGAAATGYAPAMMKEDYATIGHFMNQRFHTYDTIAAEFGSEWVFDEWVPQQMCHLRAFPRGLALQYLVGNLPLAGLYSLLRGIITRNLTLAKLPSRDPISVTGLVRTIIETDPEHPVSRSLSLAYWPHDDEVGDRALHEADTVCVWGGEQAVAYVKKRVRPGVPVAEFGPKWSAAVIDLTVGDPDEAAYRLVEDACFYDQEACFNTQQVYVRGDVLNFAERLTGYLDSFAARYPLADTNRDALAHRSATILEAQFLGLPTWSGSDWAVIVADQDSPSTHPLTRTLILHPINALTEVADHLDGRTQTLSVFPHAVSAEHRDRWARAGADRIVDLGWSRLPRSGFTHDAMYGMHPLVRLVVVERPRSDYGKYYPRPADQGTWQRSYFAGEEWYAMPWFMLGSAWDGQRTR